MDKFINYAEIQAEKAENLSFCRGIKLLHIRDKVECMLGFIGKGGIFEEYTVHSIAHIDEMLKIVEWLIPDGTKEKMTYAEWLMLTLAIYFHDLGMVVTKDEFEHRNQTVFKKYRERALQETQSSEYEEYAKEKGDVFLYQEFVRENHAIRIRQWIEGKSSGDLGEAGTVCKEIDDILKNLDNMFKADLAMICESHHKDDLDDFTKYKIKKMYGNSDNEKVNLNYIAVILRIADLLHITRDRTPSIARKFINVSNPISVLEWEKQMAVRAVRPKDQRNEDGAVDDSKQKDTIEITAYFEGAETADAYFGLSSYLQYTRKELTKCCEIIEKAQKREGAVGYEFPWREIDESQIEVKGFEKKKLQFTIAQDNILQLLVGHTLYNDSSVVVRELVQNGIDAVRLQAEYEKRNGRPYTQGKVLVEWNSQKRQLSFWDNGTGMSIQDVENYLLKVGASKYRDETVKKQFPNFSSISHFGIGILTCFMVANDIDIVTNSVEQGDANSINLRKVNGSYLLRKLDKNDLDERIKHHGTMVKLYIRSDVDMSKLENDLRKWIVIPEIPVYLTIDNNEIIRIGYTSLKEVLVKYLNETGHDVDGKKYDVYEKQHGNVTVAYAVRHMKYMSDWCLMRADISRVQKKIVLPIGTCVEGIRVEFSTPGYKNTSILAVANIKNSKYQTNVARSAIELDANNEILSDIYDVYKEYVQEQMERLEEQDYAQSWAMSEGRYLMRPLIFDEYSNASVEPIDEEVLIHRLAHLKCLTLENEGRRRVVSAEEVAELDEINIFECEMTRAGENLLKEVRSNATLSSVINVVCEDNFLKDVKNVICNIDMSNILHEYALKNKEVSRIDVAHKQRRIHLTYSSKQDLWYEFDLRNRGIPAKTLYIPKKDISISGLKDEIGVKTFRGIYVQGNTELCNYLIKVIKAFQSENSEENKILLEVFFAYVFDSSVLEVAYKQDVNTNNMFKRLLEERFIRVSNELIEKMWAKIDAQDFVDKVLTQNYTLYSIDNWSRKKSEL